MGGRPLRSIVLLSAALASVAACEVAVDPIEVPPGCPDKPLRGPEETADVPLEQLIDDFEDGDDSIAAVGGRNGVWDAMSNGSSSMLSVKASNSCAARGSWAGHFVAAGFTKHGASVTAYFRSPAGVAYDGSNYSGISFWAASGSGSVPFPASLGLSTADTLSIYDYYGTTAQLTHSWQRFVIPFTDLKPVNTPLSAQPQVPALRKEALIGLVIWPNTTQFDIWMDDVRFEL